MDRSQLMKGVLEGCILKIIESRETYGYEILSRLQTGGFPDIREGTLYPLLLRLEKKELILAVYRPSPLGPRRKYYSITNEGQKYLREFYKNWLEVQNLVEGIWNSSSSE